MMGRKQKLKSGDEWDVVTGWRKFMKWTDRSRVCKKIKKQLNKRYRKEIKERLNEEIY